MAYASDGIASHRLPPDDYTRNFSDLTPPLSRHEAIVAADRCYFCFDAPCAQACPTHIDIPLFIRQVTTGNPIGAAETIFDANILGGMCARVCPVEQLCEDACVREHAEGKPVQIGLLQRYATDTFMAERDAQPFERLPATGKRIAVVGAGPAGLSCAHRLAVLGYEVTIFDAKPKPGGLNEYGIAAYKTTNDFAQREVEFILSVGGIAIEQGKALGRDVSLEDLKADFDAVFLGLGLAGFNSLSGLPAFDEVTDAVPFIETLRQSADKATVPVGRKVVVIGGGMTAIDAAVQAKKLGAEEVTVAYRRGPEHMKASDFEQDLAKTHGVTIRHWAVPKGFKGGDGRLTAAVFDHAPPGLNGSPETVTIAADMVLAAIGQSLVAEPLGGTVALSGGRIVIDDERRTSVAGVWAGGDCVFGGQDLTVSAVEDGKQAALSIDRVLRGVRSLPQAAE